MNTIPDPQLSLEIQELYLENKEWISQLAFLQDEHRFFKKIFDGKILSGRSSEDVLKVANSLTDLKNSIHLMEKLTLKHQHLLEAVLLDKNQSISLDLIEQNATIARDIQLLLSSERMIKKGLFTFVEGGVI